MIVLKQRMHAPGLGAFGVLPAVTGAGTAAGWQTVRHDDTHLTKATCSPVIHDQFSDARSHGAASSSAIAPPVARPDGGTR